MSPSHPFAVLAETAQSLRPVAAIVLGSGMGRVVHRLQPMQSVSFIDVPGLEATTVIGHHGRLTLGEWAGRCVLVFEGRLHYYECQSWRSVVAPVQAARFLGANVLLLTNAAGGIHGALEAGSLMVIRRHIEWNRPYAWRQPSDSSESLYSAPLRELLVTTAREQNIRLHEGVYAAVTGPCYETPAEIRPLQSWGADAVGMSTTREVQAAHDGGMECAAISLITNRAAGLGAGRINHDEVVNGAEAASERLADLIEEFLRKLT